MPQPLPRCLPRSLPRSLPQRLPRRLPRRLLTTFAAVGLAGLLAACSNSGNGDSVTPNDVTKSPGGGASVSPPRTDLRTPTRIVSPSNGPG